MTQGSSALKLKGMIPCPCCGREKSLVAEGTIGKIFTRCSGCRQYIAFDFDRMSAERTGPIRGATKQYKLV